MPIKQREAFLWRRITVLTLQEFLGLSLLPGTRHAQAGSNRAGRSILPVQILPAVRYGWRGVRGFPVPLPMVGELLQDSPQDCGPRGKCLQRTTLFLAAKTGGHPWLRLTAPTAMSFAASKWQLPLCGVRPPAETAPSSIPATPSCVSTSPGTEPPQTRDTAGWLC